MVAQKHSEVNVGQIQARGVQIGNLIERELELAPHVEDAIVNNFGRVQDEVVHPTEWLDDVRAKLAELLQRNRCDGLPEVCDVEPINNGSYKTVVRALGATCWNTGDMVTEDPAAFAAKWLYQGAPAGLSPSIDLKGVCAEVDDDSPELDDASPATDFDTFSNYDGVETNPDAIACNCCNFRIPLKKVSA